MPASLPPALILVTGASGFIASWVCLTLLRDGYNVRGTVRTTGKGEYLTKLFAEYGDRFKYVLVPDVVKVAFLGFFGGSVTDSSRLRATHTTRLFKVSPLSFTSYAHTHYRLDHHLMQCVQAGPTTFTKENMTCQSVCTNGPFGADVPDGQCSETGWFRVRRISLRVRVNAGVS